MAPTLPKLFWFTPTLPTGLIVAKKFLDIKQTSPKASLRLVLKKHTILNTTCESLDWRVSCIPFDIFVHENQQIPPPIIQKFLYLPFQLQLLDNFHNEKFHFLLVQRFFHKIIHIFLVYWLCNENFRVLSPLGLPPH